jgi:hypothetical protein
MKFGEIKGILNNIERLETTKPDLTQEFSISLSGSQDYVLANQIVGTDLKELNDFEVTDIESGDFGLVVTFNYVPTIIPAFGALAKRYRAPLQSKTYYHLD